MLFKIALTIIFSLFTVINSPFNAYAQGCDPSSTINSCGTGKACILNSADQGTPTCKSVNTICDFEPIFSNIVTIAGTIILMAFFAMTIQGGLRFMFSAGDPKALQAAKGSITWGVIGVSFFSIAFIILLLIGVFTGVDVTRFKVCDY